MAKAKTNHRVPMAALGMGTIEAEIFSPKGERIPIRIRALKSYELREIMRGLEEPEPPVGDMQRNPSTGQIESIPNLKDPAYLKALNDYSERRGYLLLIHSLDNVDIPGDNDDERIAALRESLEVWAEQQILEHVNHVNGFGEREMREAQATLTPFVDESLPSLSDSDGPSNTGSP